MLALTSPFVEVVVVLVKTYDEDLTRYREGGPVIAVFIGAQREPVEGWYARACCVSPTTTTAT